MADLQVLNADLSQRVVIETDAMEWAPSPSPTVWRKRLYLDGTAEAGVVTSIVRYDAGSAFPEHGHPEGEEIFVLDGIFSDETGDYPAGTHILNPEGFRHAPFSREGCTLFVKLRQYAGADRPRQQRNTNALEWRDRRNGEVAEMPLYAQEGYDGRTSLIRFAPGGGVPHHPHLFGEEVLVLEGEMQDEFGTYGTGTWIRSPVGSEHRPWSEGGCVFFLKTGGNPIDQGVMSPK
jgi:anti-sigma factor ChrR (cupin superfamily)